MQKIFMKGEFKFYVKQETALKLGTPENNFYYATDINDKGVKAYGEPMAFSDFIAKYSKTDDTYSFYELITKGSARMEYYDIDNETDKSSKEIFYDFLEIYENFMTFRNVKTKPDWVIMDSSKKGKVSLHLINKSRGFLNEIVMKDWYDELKYFCDTHYPDVKNIFDYSVCSSNRCMRMIKSTKFGQNRPLKRAEWYHDEDLQLEDYFIQNLCEDYNIIEKIENKHVIKSNKVIDSELYINDVKLTSGNDETETLIKLILECIQKGEHSQCDDEIKNKMKYESFRNLIFAIVNTCINNGLDYKNIIDKFDLYTYYRHHDKYNKNNIMKTIYDNCENKIGQQTNMYSVKSLHFWAKENNNYAKYFVKKEIKDSDFPEIDMIDDFSFGEFSRKYENKTIKYDSDEYHELLKDFCRVVAVIDDGSLTYFIKSDKLNLRSYETVKFACKIYIDKFLLDVKDKKYTFNILDYIPKYETIDCVPFCGKKKREKYFNTFYGFQGQYVEDYDISKIDKIIYHIKNIICSGNEEYYNYIIDWLASIIQKPNEKTGVCIFGQSDPGAGKGMFIDFLVNHVIGFQNYCKSSGLEKIVGRFNIHLDGKIFCEINELQNGDNTAQSFHAAFDTMKDLITDSHILYEQKGMTPRNGKNYLNFWISTNNKFSIKVEEKDRRYFPLEVSNKKIGDFAYFDELKKCMNQESGNIFYSYLTDHKITNNLRKIPKTALKEELIENSKSIPELFVDEIKSGEYEFEGEYKDNIYPISYFYDCFSIWCKRTGNKEISLQKMTKILHGKIPDAFKIIKINKKPMRCISI